MRNEDAGWYKVKQLAVQARLHTTGRADLPFDQMMKLLKPVWERAFLPKGNLIGWRMAGLNDKGGVTARPAWLALKEITSLLSEHNPEKLANLNMLLEKHGALKLLNLVKDKYLSQPGAVSMVEGGRRHGQAAAVRPRRHGMAGHRPPKRQGSSGGPPVRRHNL